MMQDYQNKIAVITGSAKGIGKGIAQKALNLGMRVVLADIDEKALETTFAELAKDDLREKLFSVVTDVTQEDSVLQLAEKTMTHFGVPHLLFNNAGVGGYVGPLWELSTKKIRWVMDVNVMSVAHGIKAFVPHMLASKQACHIINTASMAGMYSFPYFSSYIISKHAVVALSECLHHDLNRYQADIKVSVLCPGGVNTSILDGSKDYPDVYQDQQFLDNYTSDDSRFIVNFTKMVRKGITPDATADIIFDAISNGKFYIFTHEYLKAVIKRRMEAILAENDPATLEFS